jgi:hypothetical protein
MFPTTAGGEPSGTAVSVARADARAALRIDAGTAADERSTVPLAAAPSIGP